MIKIIGAGLAGVEAAYQAAKFNCDVILYEMRPEKMTPAHHTANFAELVCSNSFRSSNLENAAGLLKQEMRMLDSIVLKAADKNRVPAGDALAVDRKKFSQQLTEEIRSIKNITVIQTEMQEIPIESDAIVIIATGPLTSNALAGEIKKLTGEDYLYFYDAAAPIITRESIQNSIDTGQIYLSSRYDKDVPAYYNCPMNEETYKKFHTALLTAEKASVHSFDQEIFFEGCLPIEEMARRGEDVLRFGPMKPVGLKNPIDNQVPYAVVQLRFENTAESLFNLVGFQTRLKWNEQKRIFRMIPGLEQAEFARFGVMHRNTFINAPKILQSTYQMKINDRILFAGQLTGVEGYIESASSGLVAGINAARLEKNLTPLKFPTDTCIGALSEYIESADPKHFQPMKINLGLLSPVEQKIKKSEKKAYLSNRALDSLRRFINGRIQSNDNSGSSS